MLSLSDNYGFLSPNYSQEKSGLEELRLLMDAALLSEVAGFTINFQPLSVASVFHLESLEKASTIHRKHTKSHRRSF